MFYVEEQGAITKRACSLYTYATIYDTYDKVNSIMNQTGESRQSHLHPHFRRQSEVTLDHLLRAQFVSAEKRTCSIETHALNTNRQSKNAGSTLGKRKKK